MAIIGPMPQLRNHFNSTCKYISNYMIKIVYFAKFRDQLGTAGEELEWLSGDDSLNALKARLAARGGVWQVVFDNNARLLVAINQEMVSGDSSLQDGDEVAFFPPVTGG